jgi:hypothetical protein
MTDLAQLKSELHERRVWPTRLLGTFLLCLQAGGLLAGDVLYAADSPGFEILYSVESASQLVSQADLFRNAYTLPFIFVLAAGIAFLSGRRAGWLLAMMAQGFTLYISLTLYFSQRLDIIFPNMIYCMVMVFYLNAPVVRAIFGIQSTWSGEEAPGE